MASIPTVSEITRTVAIDDLSPQELAVLFCNLVSGDQAQFFSAIWSVAKAWPGAGWCQQSCAIEQALDRDGREAIKVLAAHVIGTEA
jgi:hypothetical protein